MEKLVSFLKQVGVMTLGVLLLSGFLASCEGYDDTAIRDRLDKNEGRLDVNEDRLDSLEARIEALEEGYQEQVTAIQALSALQEAVNLLKTQVEKNTGDITTNNGNIAANEEEITKLAGELATLLETVNTLSGNATLKLEEIEDVLEGLAAKDVTLEEALDALGCTIVNYQHNEETGEVTIVLSDGGSLKFLTGSNALDAVKVKKDENGDSYWAVGGEYLTDAAGNKVPVAVTPEVKVDPETREVSVSADGGATWYPTGIIDEQVLPLFLSVESDEDYVYFTLADGTKLSVALSADATDVVLELSKMYVGYGETETVDINMSNIERYIVVKPEGWRVAVNVVEEEEEEDAAAPETKAVVPEGKTVLSITAPAEGVGEKAGLVSFFCVGADGRAAIYEMEVVAGLPTLTLTLDRHEESFSIAVDDKDAKYAYGVVALEGETTLESAYKAATAELGEAGVTTGAKENLALAEALELEALKLGGKYAVWAVLVDGDENGYRAKGFDKVVSVSYDKNVNISFSEVTSVDSKIKIESSADAGKLLYYIQPLDGNIADWTEEETAQKIQAQIKSASSTSDVLTDGKYDGSLLALYKEYYMPTATLVPGHTVFIAVVPENNKTEDAVVYGLVTLEGYKLDAESKASVTFGTPTENYTTVSVRVTPGENTYFRYSYMTEKQYIDEYEGDDEALMKFAIGTGSVSGEKKTAQTASPYPVVLGESYVVVIYAYDPATAVGKIFTKKLTCPAIEYNETITLAVNVRYEGVNYAEVTVVPTGGTIKSLRYAFMKKADFEGNATLKGDLKIAEEKLIINQTVSNRRNFNTANLASDNVYMLENLYLNEPDQYLFVIAFDENDKPTRMVNATIDTATPFGEGFSADLAAPTVEEVYYIANSTGYKQTLTNWSKMSDVTDVTTLNDVTGMYWLDLNWGEAGAPKRMWLCNENSQNWNTTYPITGTDKKADALSVLKKRAGYTAAGVAPDFYGLNATTGALALTGVQVMNTSEYKTIREKNTDPYSAKTIHLVWETTDGKYGYTTVVPEDYANVTPSETPDEGEGEGSPSGPVDPAASPWGHMWLYQVEELELEPNVYLLLDLGASESGVIYIAQGVVSDTGAGSFERMANYSVDMTTLDIDTENGIITWEDDMGDEYQIMWADLGFQGNKGMVTMASEESDNYYAITEMFGTQSYGTPELIGITVTFPSGGGDEGL